MVPGPGFIAERREHLVGLVITHAHEDHIGAVAHLWRELRCPVYATPFAAAVLRRKLGEAGLLNEVPLHIVPSGGSFELAPFQLQFLQVSHSIPEAQALVIRTPSGTVLHTGDWKLDPEPLVGPPTDEAAFAGPRRGRRAGHGVRQHQRHGGRPLRLRGDVRRSLTALIAQPSDGRIAVTCFAQQRGAGRDDRAGRPGRRAHGGPGRPLAAQPGCGGAGDRLPRRRAGVRPRGRGRRRFRTTTC